MSRIKLYTKKGDKGMTSLYDGTRVSKTDLYMAVLGTLDELNVHVGMTAVSINKLNRLCYGDLRHIQLIIIDISSIIATPSKRNKVRGFDANEITNIEKGIDSLHSQSPPLTEFLLPCSTYENSLAHVCRVVARRAERKMIKLFSVDEQIDQNILIYMNRLSDYFFALSRIFGHDVRVSQIRSK